MCMVHIICQWFLTLSLILDILYVYLSYTPYLNNQLLSRELHELNLICQIKKMYKMCRAVGPQARVENHC